MNQTTNRTETAAVTETTSVTETATVRGGSMTYDRIGDGPPLVLLHSLALGREMWAPVLAELGTGRQVIIPDLRGHGDSSWDGRPFSIDDLSDDVGDLLDLLGLERVDLLGMSMGGSVALTFAAARPSAIRRLVLCDTTAWYGADAPAAWEQRAQVAAGKPRPTQVPFQVERWFGDRFRQTEPRVVARAVDIFLATRPGVHAAACRALGVMDARDRLAAITAKTLVVTGADDQATPPAMGEALAGAIAGASFEQWPGLRHFAALESTALRTRLAAFLAGKRARARPQTLVADSCRQASTSDVDAASDADAAPSGDERP
jgi:3-oxoadipate enol-lactonase